MRYPSTYRYRSACIALFLTAMIILAGSISARALIQETQILDSTTQDGQANYHLQTDTVRGMYRYDTQNEPWTNPAKYNFTGWGADGKKYVSGLTHQMQGQVSYEGNVLPSEDIHGQRWEWMPVFSYDVIPSESTLTEIVDNDILHLKSEGVPAGGETSTVLRVAYGTYPEGFDASDDWILKTRVKVADTGGATIVINDGTNLYTVILFCMPGSGCSIFNDTGMMVFSGSNTQWHTLQVQKTSSGVFISVNEKVLGEFISPPIIVDTKFLQQPGVYLSSNSGMSIPMGTYPPRTELEVDYLRFETGSSEFTTVPQAPWHAEMTSTDRGATADFPDIAMVATDEEGVSLLTVRDNDRALWMRFDEGAGNAIGSTGVLEEAVMRNGKLLVPKRNGDAGDESDGLYILDFTDGFIYRLTTAGTAVAQSGIETRNTGTIIFDSAIGTGLSSNAVRQISTTLMDTGRTYAAVVEEPRFVGVVDLQTRQRTAAYQHTSATPYLGEVALAKDGTLYVMEERELYGNTLSAFYDVHTIMGVLSPSYQRNISALGRHIHVLEGASSFAGSNRLYWTAQYEDQVWNGSEMPPSGLFSQLVRYDESQGSEASGTVTILAQQISGNLRFILDMVMQDEHTFILTFDRKAMEIGGGILGFPVGPEEPVDFDMMEVQIWNTEIAATVPIFPPVGNLAAPFIVERKAISNLSPFGLQTDPPGQDFGGGPIIIGPCPIEMPSCNSPIGSTGAADLRAQLIYPYYFSMALGGSVSELLIGSFTGILEHYFTTAMTIVPTDESFGVTTPYTFTIIPAQSVPHGSTVTIQFGEGFGNIEEITPGDITFTGTNINEVSYEMNNAQRKISVTIDAAGEIQGPFTMVIGGEHMLTNPMQAGIYTISYDITGPSGEFIDSGLGRVVFGMGIDGDTQTFVLPMSADVEETMFVVFDEMRKTLRIDPLVNDGRNTSAYSQLTVGTNALGGYGLYARLDDGTGVNQLSNGNGHAIPAGLGENMFGFEATKAPYDPDRVVEADTYFTATNAIISSNGETFSTSGPSNPIDHTLYYDVDVDFSLPAGHYGGTIYFSVLSNF